MKTSSWLNQNRFPSPLRFATPVLLACVAAVFTLASPPAVASGGGSAQTYHGTLTGGDFFCNGQLLNPPPYLVTGTWNLSIDPATPAQLTLDVFYNGSQHLAWGYNALILVSYSEGVYVFSGFGGIATATLDTSVTPATFSWHVELGGGCTTQRPYNSLTFQGVADRGGG